MRRPRNHRAVIIVMMSAATAGCFSRSVPALTEAQAIGLARSAAASAGHWESNPARVEHHDGTWTITFPSAVAGYAVATVSVDEADQSTETHIYSSQERH
jgi:hypothetical protein